MPLYDYDCAACGRRIEVVHGVHAPGPTHCPNCGSGPLRKAISAPAVHFKGSGWAKKERRATVAPDASKAAGDGEAGASETGASETEHAPAATTSAGSTAGGEGTPAAPASTSAKASGPKTATKTAD
jgi:putative FmdB family regulatory protein